MEKRSRGMMRSLYCDILSIILMLKVETATFRKLFYREAALN